MSLPRSQPQQAKKYTVIDDGNGLKTTATVTSWWQSAPSSSGNYDSVCDAYCDEYDCGDDDYDYEDSDDDDDDDDDYDCETGAIENGSGSGSGESGEDTEKTIVTTKTSTSSYKTTIAGQETEVTSFATLVTTYTTTNRDVQTTTETSEYTSECIDEDGEEISGTVTRSPDQSLLYHSEAGPSTSSNDLVSTSETAVSSSSTLSVISRSLINPSVSVTVSGIQGESTRESATSIQSSSATASERSVLSQVADVIL